MAIMMRIVPLVSNQKLSLVTYRWVESKIDSGSATSTNKLEISFEKFSLKMPLLRNKNPMRITVIMIKTLFKEIKNTDNKQIHLL